MKNPVPGAKKYRQIRLASYVVLARVVVIFVSLLLVVSVNASQLILIAAS